MKRGGPMIRRTFLYVLLVLTLPSLTSVISGGQLPACGPNHTPPSGSSACRDSDGREWVAPPPDRREFAPAPPHTVFVPPPPPASTTNGTRVPDSSSNVPSTSSSSVPSTNRVDGSSTGQPWSFLSVKGIGAIAALI